MRFTFHDDFEMFVRMTDKQTKPEGSPGGQAIQLILSLHPYCQDITVVESRWIFLQGKFFLSIPWIKPPTDESLDEYYSGK